MNRKTKYMALFVGMSTMLIEMIWFRYLWILIGSSILALATITAVFMLGFSIGELLFNKLHAKITDKIKYLIFVGFSFLSILSPYINRLISYFGILNNIGVIIVLIVFLLISILLGMMIPYLISLEPKHAGTIYGMQVLGSVLGTLGAHFIFIPYLGLKISAFLCAIISIIVLLILKDRITTINTIDNKSTKKENRNIFIAIYSVMGFVFMSFQTYFIYVFVLFFSNSVYDYAIILSIYLIGSYLGNVFIRRRPNASKNRLLKILMGCLISLTISVVMIRILPSLTNDFINYSDMVDAYGNRLFIISIIKKIAISALFLLIPTMFSGMLFPTIVEGNHSQSYYSRLLGFNTLGSCLGALFSSYIFISNFGIQMSMNISILLILIIITAYVIIAKIKIKPYVFIILVFSLSVFIVPKWDVFKFSTSFLQSNQDPSGYYSVDYYSEDAYGVTSVIDFTPNNTRYLTTNRIFSQNTSQIGGLEDHRRLGYIPVLLTNNPRSILLTGLGAGITLSGVAELTENNIDVVEISEAVVNAAKKFEKENNDVLNNDNVNIVIDDARNYVAYTDAQYDLIIGDIFFPVSQGSSNLFSLEYFNSLSNVLTNKGAMMQWIPIHQFSNNELKRVIKTYSSVFKDMSLWYGMIGENTPAVGLLGWKTEETISFSNIISNFRQKSLYSKLDTVGLDDEFMLMSHMIGRGETLDLHDIQPYTDDKPQLEYFNPKLSMKYKDRSVENMKYLLSIKSSNKYTINDITHKDQEILDEYNYGIMMLLELLIKN